MAASLCLLSTSFPERADSTYFFSGHSEQCSYSFGAFISYYFIEWSDDSYFTCFLRRSALSNSDFAGSQLFMQEVTDKTAGEFTVLFWVIQRMVKGRKPFSCSTRLEIWWCGCSTWMAPPGSISRIFRGLEGLKAEQRKCSIRRRWKNTFSLNVIDC